MPSLKIWLEKRKVSKALEESPRKVGKALLRGVKRGTKAAGTHANRVVSKDMGIKVSDVRARIRLEQPSARTLTGSLHANLKRIPLIKFGARGPEPSRGRGRGVTYKSKSGRSRHPGAFIAEMSRGRGVFERKGAARTPVKELYGPSIGRVFDEHRAEIMAKGEQEAIAEFHRLLDRILGKRK